MQIRSLAGVVLAFGLLAGACSERTDQSTPTTSVQLPSNGEDASIEPNATVVFVVDGDTIHVDFDGIQESIRFIGIDTPEKTGGFRDPECYGDEASAKMHELLQPGDEVYLELDIEARDRFDRLLAYVYRAEDGLFLNQLMVTEGWAAAFPFEPNTLYAEIFRTEEVRARDLDIGLWGACGGPDLVLEP